MTQKNFNKFITLVWSFVVFIVLLSTSYPTISPYRDSGDMIVSSYTLGIAHQPGYPLYSILGKIFSFFVALGNIGYRMNLMSIIFSILSFLVLTKFFSYEEKTIYHILTLIGCSTYCFFSSVWSLSQVSEMYTIAGFFLCLVLFLFNKLVFTKNKKYFYLIIFITGISLGIHLTLISIFLSLILTYLGLQILQNVKLKFTFSDLMLFLVIFLLGLTIFLFIPIRASTGPVSNWGDAKNFYRFIRLVTRADLGILKLHPEESKLEFSIKTLLSQTVHFIQMWYKQITFLGVILAVVSIVLFIKSSDLKTKIEFVFSSLLFFMLGPLFFIFSNLNPQKESTYAILEPQLVFPVCITVYWIVYGLKFGIKDFSISSKIRKPMSIILPILITILLFNLIFKNYPIHNRRNKFLSYDYAINLMHTLKYQSSLYDPDDITTFVLRYFQLCHNMRKDIKLITFFRTSWGYELLKQQYPEIIPANVYSGIEFVTKFLSANVHRGVYVDVLHKVPQGYVGVPYGIVYKVLRSQQEENFFILKKIIKFLFYEIYFFREGWKKDFYSDFFMNKVISYYSSGLNNIAILLPAEEEKLVFLKTGLTIDPNLKELYNNFGVYYYTLKNYHKSAYFFKKVLSFNPKDIDAKYNLALTLKMLFIQTKEKKYIDETVRILKEIISINPEYYLAHNELGVIELENKNYDLAIKYFNIVISLNPEYYNGHYNLALCYKLKGDIESAKKVFNNYIPKNVLEQQEITELLSK